MIKVYLLSIFFICSAISFGQDISGNWLGELDLRGKTLEFGFKISQQENVFTTTMDVPKQGLNNIPVEASSFIDSVLTLSHPTLKFEYKGVLNQENEFEGDVVLGANTFPLKLKKGEITLNRPQEPKPPFTYYSEEIGFINNLDNVTLKGTLTLPAKEGKFPVAIIISGSGPQDRDGSVFGHKLYYVLADHLTKNGIAVLRYDERGVGESEGVFETSDIETFSSDVHSAITFLKSRKEINTSEIGVIGHSIGGIIAPKVASQTKDINFVVMLAGPGINGDVLMLSQKAAIEKIMGLSETQISQGQDLIRPAYDIIVKTNLENSKLRDSINSFYISKLGKLFPEEQRKMLAEQLSGPEFRSLIRSKPSEYLSKVQCPVLALNGSKDFQVPAEANLEAIKRILETAGNKNVQTYELNSLNHLFQECETGAKSEYSEIEQTISPPVLDLISNWINVQTK